MSRLTIFLVIHAHKHFVGQSSPVLMHHLSYKTHTRVLMPPCRWLDCIIYVAHQGMEHLQQPHLRTWQARVVARKPNGCTISLSSSCNASCRGSNG